MSLGVLRFALSRVGLLRRSVPPRLRSPFTTDAGGGASDPRSRVSFGSVGRKINQRHVQLLDEKGEELGTMHRADVIRLMDESGLKLVAIDENRDPPLYRLMRGKQIHQEQIKLRDAQKAKKGPVQSKELSFSADISLHDLETKLRQVASWLEKNHHVKLTLRAGVDSDTPVDQVLAQVVRRIALPVGFASKPSVVRGGRAAMCVLRLQKSSGPDPGSV